MRAIDHADRPHGAADENHFVLPALMQPLLGRAEGRTGLDGLRFSGRPYYWGRPWFLAPAIRYYRWHDSLGVGG